MADDFSIVIIGRRAYDHDSYCEEVKDWVKKFARLPYRIDEYERFSKRIHYVQMDFTDLNSYEMLDAFYKAHHLKIISSILRLPLDFCSYCERFGKSRERLSWKSNY